MPCDSLRTYGLKLDRMDKSLLHDALRNTERFRDVVINGDRLHFFDTKTRCPVDIAADGQMNVSGSYLTEDQTNELGNAVRQAYSREVVMTQARKFGWLITEKEPNQFTVVKR